MTYSILIPESASGDTCILPVCGCIDAMHGTKFKNLVGEAGKHFRAVRVILCDSLDAYNMAERDGPLWNEAEQVSRDLMARWYEKNENVLRRTFEKVELTSWDEIRAAPGFNARRELVRRLYEQVPAVHHYIESVCQVYVEIKAARLAGGPFVPDRGKMMRQAVGYTLEEIPGTATYFEMFGAPVLYAGAYFDDPDFFDRNNNIDPSIGLKLPLWCRAVEVPSSKAA